MAIGPGSTASRTSQKGLRVQLAAPHVMTSQADIAVRALAQRDLEAWQDFVDSMPEAGGMHHAGWYEVLRDAYWVAPHFLMAVDRDAKIVGVLSLYHSRSLVNGPYLSSLEDGVLAER